MSTDDRHDAQESQEARNLRLFDELDFDAFSKQDWTYFEKLHSDTVRVVMPDRSVVDGIQRHTADQHQMVSFLPDLKVVEHPIKVAQGDWTAVVGRATGTFSQPLVMPDGAQVEPTGQKLDITMATFARWENDEIVEEILFWDTAQFYGQLGIGG
jgi:ketosteroid isomerase-like protein